MIDWGIGHYERQALELEPVAGHVVSLAELEPRERVLDLATGTGNAALLAARAGAAVTGVDAAPRLIVAARERAAEAGLDVSFQVGDIQSLPCEDRSFDVALSVFGLIFASDADAAFAEMMRVLRPSCRAVLSVWIPAGPIAAMIGIFRRAVAETTGPAPIGFAWHEPEAVRDFAKRHGAEVRFHDGELQITAESPEAYLESTQEHPVSVASRPVLEQSGTADAAREQALAALRAGNEDESGFRVTSPYRLIEVRRRNS